MRAMLGQGARFALVGALVALVYVLATLFLHEVAGLAFQLALLFGLVIAVTTHFVLQRAFVWRSHAGFALTAQHQARRYVAITAVQYAVTALATSVLPRPLGVPTAIVYVATVICLTALTFMLLRKRVFHPAESPT